jgi:hypothetical protein
MTDELKTMAKLLGKTFVWKYLLLD